MAGRVVHEATVLDAAIGRMVEVFKSGARVVVSFSGGKDSTAVLEVTLAAARAAGVARVDVAMRDDEIMFPGTFEYAERVANRPDVAFHWFAGEQPAVNVMDRQNPFWFTFDSRLGPAGWMREPPPFADRAPGLDIAETVTRKRFPVESGQDLVSVMGIRVAESYRRRGSVASGGFLTNKGKFGARIARPIFDWTVEDVWRGVRSGGWDFNTAYNGLARAGVPPATARIVPPALSTAGLKLLPVAAGLWPEWFSRLRGRLTGMETARIFGKAAVQPHPRPGETWEALFDRVCVRDAPEWIRERAEVVRERLLRAHGGHATGSLPEWSGRPSCTGGAALASWKKLCMALYGGDPASLQIDVLGVPPADPRRFRPDWEGGAIR